MAKHLIPVEEQAVFIVPDDGTQIDVKIGSETVWLTPVQMADLFDRHHSVIRKHVRNVFSQGELAEESNAQNLRISTGGRPDTAYSLDVIISVGYRVTSAASGRYAPSTLRAASGWCSRTSFFSRSSSTCV